MGRQRAASSPSASAAAQACYQGGVGAIFRTFFASPTLRLPLLATAGAGAGLASTRGCSLPPLGTAAPACPGRGSSLLLMSSRWRSCAVLSFSLHVRSLSCFGARCGNCAGVSFCALSARPNSPLPRRATPTLMLCRNCSRASLACVRYLLPSSVMARGPPFPTLNPAPFCPFMSRYTAVNLWFRRCTFALRSLSGAKMSTLLGRLASAASSATSLSASTISSLSSSCWTRYFLLFLDAIF
mmetsp:Transcript_14663/g.46669  ORF Transcript_14663/g.46669 Transcript_14663/m.46669 type:complete len:241 (+) Transcript_14663:487-1209(+)